MGPSQIPLQKISLFIQGRRPWSKHNQGFRDSNYHWDAKVWPFKCFQIFTSLVLTTFQVFSPVTAIFRCIQNWFDRQTSCVGMQKIQRSPHSAWKNYGGVGQGWVMIFYAYIVFLTLLINFIWAFFDNFTLNLMRRRCGCHTLSHPRDVCGSCICPTLGAN